MKKLVKHLWAMILVMLMLFTGCDLIGAKTKTKALSIVDDGNGTTQLSIGARLENTLQSAALPGDKITLTLNPDEGAKFDRIECSLGNLEWPEDFTKDEAKSTENKLVYTFTMPESAVQLQVFYVAVTYKVSFGDYDTTKVSLRTDKAEYMEGEKVTVIAESDYTYDVALSVSDTVDVTPVTENKKWTFTMPAEAVTITVDISGTKYKVSMEAASSKNGVTLTFANIPEKSGRRYIYLGKGDTKVLIDLKASYSDSDNIKAKSYFYPFTEKDEDYTFTVEYYDDDGKFELLATNTVEITAKGGLGNYECTNLEQIKINIDENGNLTYAKKPTVVEDITAEKAVRYVFQPWDAISPWGDPNTAWVKDPDYYYCETWDWRGISDSTKFTYDNFNVIDSLCNYDGYSETEENTEPKIANNKKIIDTIVNKKGVMVDLKYSIKSTLDDEWYIMELYTSRFWEDGPDGHGVFVLNPSPLLGTWMGKSKAYTFNQSKVIVEDSITRKEYTYTYTDNTVSFNGETYEYEIDAARTKLSITEDDDTVKKYNRVQYGKPLETGSEASDVELDKYILKFVTAPGVKTIPAEATGYRVNIWTPCEGEYWGNWVGKVDRSLTDFSDVDIEAAIAEAGKLDEILNNKISIQLMWVKGEDWLEDFDRILDVTYIPSADYLTAIVEVKNNVIKFKRVPGVKAIPEGATSYRIDFSTEGSEGNDSGWLNRGDYDSSTFNDINIDDYVWNKKILNKFVKLNIVWNTEEGWYPVCDEIKLTNYEVSSEYVKVVPTVNGKVVTFEKPSAKIRNIMPDADGYRINVWTSSKSEIVGAKDFALDETLTVNIHGIIWAKEKVTDGKVLVSCELRNSEKGTYMYIGDDFEMNYDGYKYDISLSENAIGIDTGISIKIQNIPEEATGRTVYLIIGGNDYEIAYSDSAELSKVQATTFTYELVQPNVEYEVAVRYWKHDNPTDRNEINLAWNSIKVTPKGGSGSIIAVNAPDIKGKIEGNNFVWVEKPTIIGNHTNGYFAVEFFTEDYKYICGKYVPYQELIKNSYTEFDIVETFKDADKLEALEKATTLRVLYKYDADDGSDGYKALSTKVNQNWQSFTGFSFELPKED